VDFAERPALETFAPMGVHELQRFGYALTGNDDLAADLICRWAAGQTPPSAGAGAVNYLRLYRRMSATALGDDSIGFVLPTLTPRQRAARAVRCYQSCPEVQVAAGHCCASAPQKAAARKARAAAGRDQFAALLPALDAFRYFLLTMPRITRC